jgi:hypothetical protein
MPLLSTLLEFTKEVTMTDNITFMGIPITDTLRVVDALNEFIETRVVVCEELAEGFDEVEFYSADNWDMPFIQSVSWRHCVVDTEDMRRHHNRRIGVRKSKENK